VVDFFAGAFRVDGFDAFSPDFSGLDLDAVTFGLALDFDAAPVFAGEDFDDEALRLAFFVAMLGSSPRDSDGVTGWDVGGRSIRFFSAAR